MNRAKVRNSEVQTSAATSEFMSSRSLGPAITSVPPYCGTGSVACAAWPLRSAHAAVAASVAARTSGTAQRATDSGARRGGMGVLRTDPSGATEMPMGTPGAGNVALRRRKIKYVVFVEPGAAPLPTASPVRGRSGVRGASRACPGAPGSGELHVGQALDLAQRAGEQRAQAGDRRRAD